MTHPSIHLYIHLSSIKKMTAFDRLIMAVSLLYPLSALPQIGEVFSGNTEGVSLVSWIIFFASSALFLTYGIKHKVMPMIVSNSLWVIMDALVVVGIILN